MNLTLCMIVKNEAHVIRRALASVRPFIQSYSISDTGSTDNTKAIIAEELKDIPGVLASDAWVDFGTNRNLAMSRASGTHCVTLDADEILRGTLLVGDDLDGYQLQLSEHTAVQGKMEYWSTRICRNDGQWKWVGAMHECLCHPDPVIGRLALASIYTPHDGARDKAGNKMQGILAHYEAVENERLLRHGEYTEDDRRDVFYHAQTLYGAGRIEEAIEKYTERAKMGGAPQEVYYAAYQAGQLKAKLGYFENAIAIFLKAWKFRPTRYEALVWACMILRRIGRHEEAYLYSARIPKPSQDFIFVELDAEWRLLEEHALASVAMGEINEAKTYFEYALTYNMADIHRERMERNRDRMAALLEEIEEEVEA